MNRSSFPRVVLCLLAACCPPSSGNPSPCQSSNGFDVGPAPATQLSFDVDCTFGGPSYTSTNRGEFTLPLTDCVQLAWSFVLADGSQFTVAPEEISPSVTMRYSPYSASEGAPYSGVGPEVALNLLAPNVELSDGSSPDLSVEIPMALYDAGASVPAWNDTNDGDVFPDGGLSCYFQNRCANVGLLATGPSYSASVPITDVTAGELAITAAGALDNTRIALHSGSLTLAPPDTSDEQVCSDGEIHYPSSWRPGSVPATGGTTGGCSGSGTSGGGGAPDAGPTPWNSIDGGTSIQGSLAFPLRFAGEATNGQGLAIVLASTDLSAVCPADGGLPFTLPGIAIEASGSGTFSLPSETADIYLSSEVVGVAGAATDYLTDVASGTLTLSATAEGATGTFQGIFAARALPGDGGYFPGGTISGTFDAPFCTGGGLLIDVSGANGANGSNGC